MNHQDTEPVTITRDGSDYQFATLDIDSFESWIRSCGCAGVGSNVVVSDLALGAWRGHQVATEFAEQLTIELPQIESLPKHSGRDQKVSSEFIDQTVDAETRGHLGVLASLAQATAMVGHLRQSGAMELVVIAPLDGQDFGSQNRRFLQFMADGLRDHERTLWIVTDALNPSWLPQRWTLKEKQPVQTDSDAAELLRVDRRWASVPGILANAACPSPTGRDALAVALGKGRRLVLPGERMAATTRSRPQVLRPAEGASTWVVAYQQAKGLYRGSDMKAMGDYAWQCFQQGDLELGRRLLSRASDIADFPSPQGDLLISLLAMQIASHKFESAQQEARTPRGLPFVMRRQWARGKALCAALTGRGEQAEAFLLRSSDESSKDPLQWNDLYAKNLMALAYFLQGRPDDALELQKSISGAIEETAGWQIRYLNLINTARLHRAGRRYEEALECYTKAFGLTKGIRKDGDLFYMNICLARIEEDLGNEDRAAKFWLIACLHFAANPAPEALGWRTLAALLKRRVENGEECVDEVAEKLTQTLTKRLGVHESNHAPPICYTHHLTHKTLNRGKAVLAASGCKVKVSEAPLQPAFDSPQHRKLRSVLWAALSQHAKRTNRRAPGAVLVDAGFDAY